MELKHCTDCKRDLELSCFFVDRSHSSGLHWRCKECTKKYNRFRLDGDTWRPTRRGRKPRECPDGTRWCGRCRTYLEFSKFTNNERTCKECKKYKAFQLSYGLTKEKYETLIESQEGRCAVCKMRDARYVDHNHITGEVRGLLCPQCNTGLGMFQEDIKIFEAAMEYLQNSIARNET